LVTRDKSAPRDLSTTSTKNNNETRYTDDYPKLSEFSATEIVRFDGNFECANIEQVRQREAKTYDVWIRNDTNGQGELQWFMFRMRNTFSGTIRINIVNFTKTQSLFQNVSFLSLRIVLLNLHFRECCLHFGQNRASRRSSSAGTKTVMAFLMSPLATRMRLMS